MACYSVLTEQKAMKAIERPLQLLPPCFARKQVSAPGSTAIPLLSRLLKDFQINNNVWTFFPSHTHCENLFFKPIKIRKMSGFFRRSTSSSFHLTSVKNCSLHNSYPHLTLDWLSGLIHSI